MLASLNNSVVFKKLFREPDILTAFVKDLVAIDLSIDASNIEIEKRFHPSIGHIDIAMDIFVDDPKHRVVVEIQRVRYDYHFDRFWHYHQVATIEMAKSYQSYKLNRGVYTIVWLTAKSSDPLFQHGIITTSLCSETDEGEQLDIFSHKLICINAFYPSEHIPPQVADWLELVRQSIEHPRKPKINLARPIIKKASSLIQEEDLTPRERAQILEEKGAEEHLRLKKEEGFKEGRKEGQKEGQQKLVRNMSAKGYNVAQIADMTGLLSEEVAALLQ